MGSWAVGKVGGAGGGLGRDIRVLTLFSANFSNCFISGNILLSLIHVCCLPRPSALFSSFQTAGVPVS